MTSIEEVKAFFEKLRGEQSRGIPVHVRSLRNTVSFSEKIFEIGEFSVETRKGSKLSLAAFLYLSKDSLPSREVFLLWYDRSKANRALHYALKLEDFEAELASGRVPISKIADARFWNSEGTFVEYFANITPFAIDRAKKDPEPFEVFVRMVSGGVSMPSRTSEYENARKISEANGLTPLSHHGEEVKGVWIKPAPRRIFGYDIDTSLGHFLSSAKALASGGKGGGRLEVELRNAETPTLLVLGNIEGLRLETRDELYDSYHITISKKHLEIFMSLFADEIETAFGILAYYGFSPTPKRESPKPKTGKPGLPIVG